MSKAKTLGDLFHDTLKDIYYAEKKILSALPKMAKAAQSEELRAAFELHLEEIEGQVERLEAVFEEIEARAEIGGPNVIPKRSDVSTTMTAHLVDKPRPQESRTSSGH